MKLPLPVIVKIEYELSSFAQYFLFLGYSTYLEYRYLPFGVIYYIKLLKPCTKNASIFIADTIESRLFSGGTILAISIRKL
jgi:hypothetical protein